MLSGIEKSLIGAQEIAVKTIKLLLIGKPINEIAATLNIPIKKVIEIKSMFESD